MKSRLYYWEDRHVVSFAVTMAIMLITSGCTTSKCSDEVQDAPVGLSEIHVGFLPAAAEGPGYDPMFYSLKCNSTIKGGYYAFDTKSSILKRLGGKPKRKYVEVSAYIHKIDSKSFFVIDMSY